MRRCAPALAAVALAAATGEVRASGLIFSEYVEGSGNSKGLEIYNTDSVAADLTSVEVHIYANGSAIPTAVIAINDVMLAPGETFVLAHSSAAFAGAADQLSSLMTFNGNDAVTLFASGVTLDVIGQIGFDPGPGGWGVARLSTNDATLRRKEMVCAGDAIGSDAFSPALEWTSAGVNVFSGLGSHQSICDGAAVPWETAPDFAIEYVGAGYQLPTSIAFVPNPDLDPFAPLYYVAELHGTIKVVRRNGAISTFASGLLDYNPLGPIPGSGEQGLTGIAVERDAINPAIYHVYATMLWDNGSPPGGPNHYPKIERISSAAGGLTIASRVVLLNMQPETQGQAHYIASPSIGPDGKVYVHMGDGFNAATALDTTQYRGKVLRMNKDGTAPFDNPLYNPGNGITATDYIFTSGHRNPTGGAWRNANASRYIVERGTSMDRMARLTPGASYGWNGAGASLATGALFLWNPIGYPSGIAMIQAGSHGNSGFPIAYDDRAYVTLAGATYASGAGTSNSKCVLEFSDLDSVGGGGLLTPPPRVIARYIGGGFATAHAIAAGPDGLYLTELFEDSGVNGSVSAGARILRLTHVPQCPADTNNDGQVNVTDLLAVISAWGPCVDPDNCPPDINSDDAVNVTDLLAVISAWGACP